MNDKVKETAEELLIKIIDFIFETEPDKEEQRHRLLELACSLIMATIDLDQDSDHVLQDIFQACEDVKCLTTAGAIKYKCGDESIVKKEWKPEK